MILCSVNSRDHYSLQKTPRTTHIALQSYVTILSRKIYFISSLHFNKSYKDINMLSDLCTIKGKGMYVISRKRDLCTIKGKGICVLSKGKRFVY